MKQETPRKSANLLFLYGPTGSGKTRLLQMIAESLSEKESVIRVGSEQIVEEMYQSVVQRNFTKVFDRYAQVTNLLIDNLWILKSRPAMTKEMGKLVKARTANGNLTILSSDLLYEDVLVALPDIGDCLKEKSVIKLKLSQADGRQSGANLRDKIDVVSADRMSEYLA